jgi:hypothetical protein
MAIHTRQHKTLGTLRFEEAEESWKGQVDWTGHSVALSVTESTIDVHDSVLDSVSNLLVLFAERVHTFIVDELLELYNDTWCQDDVTLDSDAFMARITTQFLEVIAEGDATAYFDDGGLFGSHCILVTIDSSGTLVDAKLAG